jgi:hypothetical protein
VAVPGGNVVFQSVGVAPILSAFAVVAQLHE